MLLVLKQMFTFKHPSSRKFSQASPLFLHAFSLIELLTVIAILGILSAFAIPAYNSYRLKAHVAEGLSLASSFEKNIMDLYHQNDAFPCCGTGDGTAALGPAPINNPTPYISVIQYHNGGIVSLPPRVILIFNSSADDLSGKELWLYATATSQVVTWKCKPRSDLGPASTIAKKYLPVECHN